MSLRWGPGLHLVLAYTGTGLLVVDRLTTVDVALGGLGAVLWSLGVSIFVGSISWTVIDAFSSNRDAAVTAIERHQQSTCLATVVVPIALGYLVVGTVALLSLSTPLPDYVGATVPAVVHYYGAGFAALLVYGLGIRLLTGFFHVRLSQALSRAVLVSGSLAPAILVTNFLDGWGFALGASLEGVAMLGYAGLVGSVVYRTARYRVGLVGIGLGAVFGVLAVALAVFVVAGRFGRLVDAHAIAMLNGFLLLTIVGYAVQFFPVVNRQFSGATERTVMSTFLLIATGVTIQLIVAAIGGGQFRTIGVSLVLLGTSLYVYLVTRRLLS